MTNRRIQALVIALCAIVTAPSGARGAACSQSAGALSQADSDWWAVHGCQSSYIQWHYKAYHLTDNSSWIGSNNGWEDMCNKFMNYPKSWSASFLVCYGLSDNPSTVFHFSQSDYRPLAEAASGNFHDSSEYWAPANLTNGAYGEFSYDCCDDNDITLGCPLFNVALDFRANPASRAGDFMHESWHAWEDKWDYDINCKAGHRCQAGNCTTKSCDYWHWHKISTYAQGQLYLDKTGGHPGHRPNQVQVEFLCDVNQYPAPNVPMSVRNAAKSDANNRAANRFINGPGYKCGDPRPW